MSKTYRIKSAISMGNACPPDMAYLVFPEMNGWPCELSGDGKECLVTAPSPQIPADLGPLVKVEAL